jgi:hypothetical protein
MDNAANVTHFPDLVLFQVTTFLGLVFRLFLRFVFYRTPGVFVALFIRRGVVGIRPSATILSLPHFCGFGLFSLILS